jgi:hypothetical protein
MSVSYAQLLQSVQDITGNTNATFVTNIPFFVARSEEKIHRKAQLLNFRKNSTGVATTSNQYLSTPTDYLAPYSVAVIDTGTHYYLDEKDVSFLREAYPVAATEDRPTIYGFWDDNTLILAPTPDAGYTIELHYFYLPESIVTASTTWLGTNAENALLYGTLVEAAVFMKSEEDVKAAYDNEFEKAMLDLKILGEGFAKTDNYRSGDQEVARR